MSENERLVATTAEEVFAVLADGWSYADWVVGAARIRDVDPNWPEPGARIHHSVGLWPALLHDVTVVEECDRPHRLRLQVHAWPSGAGRVELTLIPTPEGCLVQMTEEAVSGPARKVPRFVQDSFLHWRNTEALRRLAMRAEGQSVSN
jgi:uncharacterized protein YndB with AHSA1/START domain